VKTFFCYWTTGRGHFLYGSKGEEKNSVVRSINLSAGLLPHLVAGTNSFVFPDTHSSKPFSILTQRKPLTYHRQ